MLLRQEEGQGVHSGENRLQDPSLGLAAGVVILQGCGLCPLSWNCSPVTAVGTEELILELGFLPLLCAGYCGQGNELVSFQRLRLLVVNV